MQENAMDKLYLEEKENSKDGLICASTGSGKTYAFLMPVLMRFLLRSDEEDKEDKTKVKAIAVLPTRELAQQVFEKAKGLFEEANGINVALCVGGYARTRKMRKISLNENRNWSSGRLEDVGVEEAQRFKPVEN